MRAAAEKPEVSPCKIEPELSQRTFLNRAKPTEQAQVDMHVTGDVDKFIARINRARQRVADEKKRRGG